MFYSIRFTNYCYINILITNEIFFFCISDTCTSLSKELCVKTAEGVIIDHIFHFLQYSNQSQPSVAAREPAIRVLNNLLRYHETSWLIWTVCYIVFLSLVESTQLNILSNVCMFCFRGLLTLAWSVS